MSQTGGSDPRPDATTDASLRHAKGEGKSGATKALIGLAVLLGVLVAGGAAAYVWFQNSLESNVETIPDPFAGVTNRPEPAPVDEEAGEEAPMNFLVLGSDSRISAGDPSQWEAGAQRTDSIMLVHLAGDRESAEVISIPRDSWVEIPGYGYNKINAAFSFGGPTLMIQTVEDLTGVRIDHFAVADFESFVELTDALGGVDIRVADGAPDGQGGYYEGGVQHMDGEQALAYTRERKDLANGDFGRVQRQQAWMRAIMAEVNNNRDNLVTMTKFLTAVSESVAVDEGLDIGEMRDILVSSRNIGSSDVDFITMPYEGTGRSADGQSIVVLDEAAMDPLMQSVADDTAHAYIQENAAELNVLAPTVK